MNSKKLTSMDIYVTAAEESLEKAFGNMPEIPERVKYVF